ncbi:MAG TPA: uracil-DNA glycosylase, partial [Candidatus Angelobacter sp.]
MPKTLDPETRKQLAARVSYYREMGIYDFYRQPVAEGAELILHTEVESSPVETMSSAKKETQASAPLAKVTAAAKTAAPAISPTPTALQVIGDKPAALKLIREDIGDCTRCRLHKGRTNLVFGVGNVDADIMFVG